MKTRYYALVFGLVALVLGILGFIPSLLTPLPAGAPPMAMGGYYGVLFGLFPVNVLHNLINVVLGLWGLAAWRNFDAARVYARTITVIMAVLAVFGLVAGFDTLFGLVPLYSNDVWLHAVFAVVGAYFGWAPVRQVSTAGEPTTIIRR
jgi:hypothetical protein